MTDTDFDTDFPELSAEDIRQREVRELVRGELREAVLDGLLEAAKPDASLATRDYIRGAVIARLTGILEERAELREDWAGVLCAMRPPYLYEQLFGNEEASEATHRALVEELEQTIAEYVER